jgi:hypothetical protein
MQLKWQHLKILPVILVRYHRDIFKRENVVVVVRKAASVRARHVMDLVLLFVWLRKFSHPFLANFVWDL